MFYQIKTKNYTMMNTKIWMINKQIIINNIKVIKLKIKTNFLHKI